MKLLASPDQFVKDNLTNGYRAIGWKRGRHGKVSVGLGFLLSKLSKVQAEVWLCLVGLRDKQGVAHPTVDGLCRMTKAKKRTVYHALSRLRQFGLVTAASKQWVARIQKEVYVRSVWGEIEGDEVIVSPETVSALGARVFSDPRSTEVTIGGKRFYSIRQAAKAHGVSHDTVRRWIKGARFRKIAPRPTQKKAASTPIYIRGKRFESLSAASEHFGLARQTTHRRVARGVHPVSAILRPGGVTMAKKKGYVPITRKGAKSDAVHKVAPRYSNVDKQCSFVPPTGGLSPTGARRRAHVGKTFCISEDGKSGSWQAGGNGSSAGWWPWLVRNGHVPEPPHRCGIPDARVGVPQCLRPDDTPEGWAEDLAAAFRNVLRASGSKTWAFSRGKIENSKHFDRLVEWASLMTSLDREKWIAPVFWVRFMLQRWAHTGSGKKGREMAPSYCFNPETLAKSSNRGWCRKELGLDGVRPGRLMVSEELARLRRRYTLLRLMIQDLGPWSAVKDVRAVVDKVFPDDLHAVMVQAAIAAQTRLRIRLDERLAAGDPALWGSRG